ncbi:MAG: hypothetical protein KDH98_21815 [Calditrichaeota bacterium]|nr:hypothetical protein [Calditrichota bacterium]MCB9066345.1 hypothetical protein [Calditrichia bacterium]
MQIKYYQIDSPVPGELTIERSRSQAIVPFLFLLIFTCFWYYGILFLSFESDTINIFERIRMVVERDPFLIIFLLVPVAFLIPQLLKYARMALVGEKYFFHGGRGIIEKNGQYLASFSEVEALRWLSNPLKTRNNLQLAMRNGSAHSLISAGNAGAIQELSEKIAAILECPIEHRDLPADRPTQDEGHD